MTLSYQNHKTYYFFPCYILKLKPVKNTVLLLKINIEKNSRNKVPNWKENLEVYRKAHGLFPKIPLAYNYIPNIQILKDNSYLCTGCSVQVKYLNNLQKQTVHKNL